MFLPENIDLANSENYNLSIRLAPNGFSFCISSPTEPSVFYFQETTIGTKLSYLESIKKFVFDLGIFSNTFNKSSIFVVSKNYTLIPEQFYDQKLTRELFNFNFHAPEGVILNDKSYNSDYHIDFNIDEQVYSFLKRHLCNPTFHHHSTSLIYLLQNNELNRTTKECFIDFHDEFMTVICFSENKLLTANTFAETNTSNISYFVMGIWNKLGFDQDIDKLYLSGKIELQQRVEEELKSMIKNIENFELEPVTTLSKEQKQKVPTDLIAILCV